MKLEEIKEQLNNTKADFYLNDRKGWFESFDWAVYLEKDEDDNVTDV